MQYYENGIKLDRHFEVIPFKIKRPEFFNFLVSLFVSKFINSELCLALPCVNDPSYRPFLHQINSTLVGGYNTQTTVLCDCSELVG
jgi:hypothetical protein